MKGTLAIIVVLASASLATTSSAGATSAGRLCRTFKRAGLAYHYETLGSGWTCASAKRWIVKLSGNRVGTVTANVTLRNGPRGYHCFATPFSRGGRATAGSCIKGTIAFPKSGFAWTGE
jgi:hypothetical protein